MEEVKFPSCVGNDPDRAIAIIRTRLGPSTHVRFVIVRHERPQSVASRSFAASANEVVLHLDIKWNAICRTPIFRGVLRTEAEEWGSNQDGDSLWESDCEY